VLSIEVKNVNVGRSVPLNGGHQLGFAELQSPHHLRLLHNVADKFSSLHVPQFEHAIIGAADEFGLIELQAGHGAVVANKGRHTLSALHIPDLQGAVRIPTHEDVSAELQ